MSKPEWAFANILDQVYEHQSFVVEYLQSLADRAGCSAVNVKVYSASGMLNRFG